MNTLPANPWIQYRQHRPQARLRLFCFPHAGGNATLFRTWSDSMPMDIEVCPVELPGRGMRLAEKPFDQLPPLIEALASALLPCLNEPFAFFGHSMGALICFELTRHLRRIGAAPGPQRLFVAGHRAPHMAPLTPPVHHLPEAEFIAELRHLQGTPEAILQDHELLRFLLPVLRADFALCETYTYTSEKALSCPISAFGGLQDKDTPRDMLSAWRTYTSNTFNLRFFPGNHFFVKTEEIALIRAIYQDSYEWIKAISRGGYL